jgi:hypothetical protein
MATIAVTPIVLKDAIVSIDADDYAAAVSVVTLTPTAQVINFTGLKPGAVFSDVSQATWACGLTFAQDWGVETSLSRYLFDHEGETVDAVIASQDGIGTSWEVSLIITPGAIGGTVNQVPTSTVTLGVQGRPVPVDPAP